MKKYKGIFFDWDGTAVLSRKAPVDEVVLCMKKLLQQKVYLAIISGTTYEKLALGKLEQHFTPEELQYLFLGLGRGAYNYKFDEAGKPYVFKDEIPYKNNLLAIHRTCFDLHCHLLEKYDWETDIVFSRPNYCKIDLMVENDRGDQLFLQEGEMKQLSGLMEQKNFYGGMQGLLQLAEEMGEKYGLTLQATTDAKFLEVGLSSKSNNVNCILEYLEKQAQITAQDCSFFGDEYIAIEQGIYGSDSFMLTAKSAQGDFFDVSEAAGDRPEPVKVLGGGVDTFIEFLKKQSTL